MVDIPEGWVRMAAYDDRPDKKHGNPGDDYRVLLRAAKSKQIRFQIIPGVRGMLVLKEEADALLENKIVNDSVPELIQQMRDLLDRLEAAS